MRCLRIECYFSGEGVTAASGILTRKAKAAAHSRQPIPLITNDKNGIYQRIMDRWLSQRKIVLENVIELGNTETVKSCVAGDLGIALLPRFAVEPQLADGTLRTVESDFSRESVTAVCSHHKNK